MFLKMSLPVKKKKMMIEVVMCTICILFLCFIKEKYD